MNSEEGQIRGSIEPQAVAGENESFALCLKFPDVGEFTPPLFSHLCL